MARGVFITFEGGEGCGKSTQTRLLSQAFEKSEFSHILTREPGGTAAAESIRNLLVNGDGERWDAMTETLLFAAARVDHARKKIIPALREGKAVICDRFADSTLVYQGISKGMGVAFIEMLHRFTLGNLAPDLTLILDMPPEEGLKRANGRGEGEGRFEGYSIEFHQKVRDGFRQVAAREPNRCLLVDASGAEAEVQRRIQQALRERLGINL